MTATAPLTGADLLDSFTGSYGRDWKAGIISEHVEAATEAGLQVLHLKNGSSWVWAIGAGRGAVRLVCSELISVYTEDGYVSGRCGLPTVDGVACEGHAIEDLGECQHGMSASLCAGPDHYPAEF